MRKASVRSPEDALAYLTDCTLATVASMAMKKSRPKGEFQRQISISQTACDWLKAMEVDVAGTRAEEVFVDYKGNVQKWAQQYMPENQERSKPSDV